MIFKDTLMTSKDIKGIIILTTFAVVTALIFNHLSPNGIAFFGQWDKKNGVINANGKEHTVDNAIEILSPKIVRQMIRSHERTIIDVRSRYEYNQGHLPKALSFPLMEFDDNVPQMMATIKPHDPILLYCSSAECDSSHTFAEHLKLMGFVDVKVFSGGVAQWQDAGYEVEKNEG